MPDWSAITCQLEAAGIPVVADQSPQAISGGDISAAWRLATRNGNIFVKTGPQAFAEHYAAEADGLAEIAATGTIRVPTPLATGLENGGAFLAIEWLELEPANANTQTQLGEQLAAMHAHTSGYFGWHRDNTIGRTPQHNTRSKDWARFFAEHRLGFQLQLALQNGYGGQLQSRGAQLLERLPKLLGDRQPDAALLHGDLWAGNSGCSNGHAVVFDPAVYYGDRESDIAMTRLFGGFGRGFYEAYETHWPKSAGYRERECLYQLYHVLNHLNLFGRSYLGRAVALINQLL